MFYRSLFEKFKDWVAMTNNEELVNTAYETSNIIEYDNILYKFENFMHRNIDEDVLVHLVDDYC